MPDTDYNPPNPFLDSLQVKMEMMTSMTMLYCPNGHGASAGQFCPQCGAALTTAPTVAGDALRIRSPEAHASVNPTFIMSGAAVGEGPAQSETAPISMEVR